jgi:hypothetical protein
VAALLVEHRRPGFYLRMLETVEVERGKHSSSNRARVRFKKYA